MLLFFPILSYNYSFSILLIRTSIFSYKSTLTDTVLFAIPPKESVTFTIINISSFSFFEGAGRTVKISFLKDSSLKSKEF